MKYVLSILAFGLLLSLCSAQNWAPLNLTDKYNYRLGGASYITNTLWVDSVTVNGPDSVFHLNRIVTACDTCQLHWTGQAYKLANQGQFLQKTMVKKPNGWYVFDGKSRFTINPNAGLGEAWVFDTSQNITATVVGISEVLMPFGVTDSVKSFSLSSGELLLLTKHHGFQNFPDLSGSELFDLTGIEGRDLGEKVPGFQEFYDFEVGDVFMFYNYTGDAGSFYQLESYTRLEIIGKQILGDTLKYNTNASLLKIYGFPCGQPWLCSDTTSVVWTNETWVVEDLPIFINSYPNELLKIDEQTILPFCPWPYYHVQLGLDSLGIMTKSISDYNSPYQPSSVGYDLEGELLVPRDGNAEYCFLGLAYKPGLGKTFLSSGYFENGQLFKLLGYIKGQDTVGVILSDEDLYVNATKNRSQTIQLKLAPNPAHQQVQLTATLPHAVSAADLTVFDVLGSPLFQQRLRPNGTDLNETISLDALPPGIYWLRVAADGGAWMGRLVVR